VQVTSTRTVDDLVKALGADTGISKSEVSRICADLDTEARAFRDRPLTEQRFPWPSCWAAGACVANVKRITSLGTSWSNDSSQSWASALTRQDFNSRTYTELASDINLVS
jgi:Transposase, Mutator family